MAKVKTTSLLVDSIEKNYFNNKDESLYKDNFNRKDLVSINKATKMLNKKNLANINENTKMLNIKHITCKSKYIISTWLRLEI